METVEMTDMSEREIELPTLLGRWMYLLGILPAGCELATGGGHLTVTLVAELFCGLLITLAIGRLRAEAKVVARQAAMLKRSSETDALTGLRNRRGLLGSIGVALRTAERRREPLSLAFFDLDGFKKVNDTLGHAAGDRLLAAVSAVLRSNLRAGMDEAFRIGGDEFVVVMRGTSAQGARRFADRVRLGMKSHPSVYRLEVEVDVSAGVASALCGESADELVARADAAMFRAKAAGKGRTVCDSVEQPVRMMPRSLEKLPAA